MLLALIILALACSLLTLRIAIDALHIAQSTRKRIDQAEQFMADCINPDGDAMVVRLIRE